MCIPDIKYTCVSALPTAPVSGQTADLWMCSKHVQRRKSDLCEIDIVMSSLRDTGYDI